VTSPGRQLRTVEATRYVTPLREGGSLPAIVEADDDGMYVVKFRGAGQGPKSLIAELIAGEIGRALDLPIPEIVFVTVDASLGNTEPDSEIQALLKKSDGLNLGLDFLPGALAYNPAIAPKIDPALAALTVWFDSFVLNVDRTPRNPNIVLWRRQPWLIDHGAALYIHHTWVDVETRARTPFAQVAEHLLLPHASSILAANEFACTRITPALIESIVALTPDSWLNTRPAKDRPVGALSGYVEMLTRRLEAAAIFSEEAERVRTRRL
jgi:hypothetical protein